jgi:CBS domain-containing protein
MLRLRDIMTTDVVAVSPTTTLREAAELLSAHHIGGAPVLEGSTVVGVVSTSDILTFVAATAGAPSGDVEPEAADDWEEPTPGDDDDSPARYFAEQWDDSVAEVVEQFAGSGMHACDALDEHTVGEIMTREVVALPPTAPVAAAAERIQTADVHRVLVMEGGVLHGLVTTRDIARVVADGRVARRTYVFDASPLERDHDRGEF